jgi:hypothetical protein
MAREVVPSAARTTSGNSGAIELAYSGQSDIVSLLLSVTAFSGTPSMTQAIEWSHDGTIFAPADAADTMGAAIAGVAARVKVFTVKGPFYRIVWTITGGTPSLTFSMSEHAVT